MSRYHIPGYTPGLTIHVGWDNPLQTFFAQVVDHEIDNEEESMLVWVGTDLCDVPTLAALLDRLAAWAVLPPEVMGQLTRDQAAATPPTSLQQAMGQLLAKEKTGL